MYCKKIRDDKDLWLQLEEYISEHSDAEFSHGMCPACYDKEMKEYRGQNKKRWPGNSRAPVRNVMRA